MRSTVASHVVIPPDGANPEKTAGSQPSVDLSEHVGRIDQVFKCVKQDRNFAHSCVRHFLGVAKVNLFSAFGVAFRENGSTSLKRLPVDFDVNYISGSQFQPTQGASAEAAAYIENSFSLQIEFTHMPMVTVKGASVLTFKIGSQILIFCATGLNA
jgi:hypothetical protein